MAEANMKSFHRVLTDWLINDWRPQKRFNGKFDVAVLVNSAVPWLHPNLSAALDAAIPNAKRYKGTWRRGCHKSQPITKLLRQMTEIGLLKVRGSYEHGWYDIPKIQP